MKRSIVKGVVSGLVMIVIASMTNLNGLFLPSYAHHEKSHEVELVRIEECVSTKVQTRKKARDFLRSRPGQAIPKSLWLIRSIFTEKQINHKLYVRLCTFLI